jgi:hypothetical protein
MATFGKVLAVFNVLAAIAFLTLSAMDYNKRQGWSYAHFRSELAVHGLPVDATDDTGHLPGRPVAPLVTAKMQDDLFRSVGGSPVSTQVDAVKQTVKSFDDQLAAAPDLAKKRDILAARLLPLQTRGDLRDQMIHDLRNLKTEADVQKLSDQLKAIADKAIDPQANGGKRDLEERRRAIADFLYNYDPTSEWHARVQTVVGLEQYAAAADRQYANLRDMAQRLRGMMADDQATFVGAYEAEKPKLHLLADRLKAFQAKLAERQELVQSHTVLRNARMAEVDDLQKQIAAAQQTVAKERASLQGLQDQLFALQQEFAKDQATNGRLERELRSKEAEK